MPFSRSKSTQPAESSIYLPGRVPADDVAATNLLIISAAVLLAWVRVGRECRKSHACHLVPAD